MFRLLWHVFSLPLAMGFFGIGGGPSGEEQGSYKALTSASDFAIGQGESDITAGSQFMQNILSGDPTKIATALAPQISAGQVQTQEAKNQVAQQGSRSGGTAATVAGIDAGERGHMIDLVGSLTGNSANNLLSAGTNLLGTGISGRESGFGEAKTMQDQHAAMFNDIFSSAASVSPGGFAGSGSNIAGGIS